MKRAFEETLFVRTWRGHSRRHCSSGHGEGIWGDLVRQDIERAFGEFVLTFEFGVRMLFEGLIRHDKRAAARLRHRDMEKLFSQYVFRFDFGVGLLFSRPCSSWYGDSIPRICPHVWVWYKDVIWRVLFAMIESTKPFIQYHSPWRQPSPSQGAYGPPLKLTLYANVVFLLVRRSTAPTPPCDIVRREAPDPST